MDERARWEERLRKEGLYLKQHRREVQAFSWVLEKATYKEQERGERDLEVPLASLSPMQREVIYCLFYDMRSLNETAKHLGISRSSVRVHKKRALRKLEALIPSIAEQYSES